MRRTLLMLCLTFIVLFGALATTAFANSTPVGSLDVVTSTRVAGWAWDRDAGAGQIWIHIYVRRPNMTVRTVKAVTTPIYRSDVNSHLGRTYGFWGGGYHGFDTKIALKPGEIITAHAINAPAGYNPALGTKRVPRYPRGNVDIIKTGVKPIGRISGWAKDDDRLSSRIPINIYKGTTVIKKTWANKYRRDVGSYAFDVSFPLTLSGNEDLQVWAMGVSYTGAHDQKNTLIGRVRGWHKANSIITRKPLANGGSGIFMEGNSWTKVSEGTVDKVSVKAKGYFKAPWESFWRQEWDKPEVYSATSPRKFPTYADTDGICYFTDFEPTADWVLLASRYRLDNPVWMWRAHVDYCKQVNPSLAFRVDSAHRYWKSGYIYKRNTSVECGSNEDCWFKSDGSRY